MFRAIDDRDRWSERERVRKIHASSTTWCAIDYFIKGCLWKFDGFYWFLSLNTFPIKLYHLLESNKTLLYLDWNAFSFICIFFYFSELIPWRNKRVAKYVGRRTLSKWEAWRATERSHRITSEWDYKHETGLNYDFFFSFRIFL